VGLDWRRCVRVYCCLRTGVFAAGCLAALKKIDLFKKTDFPPHLRDIRFSTKIHTAVKFGQKGIYRFKLQCTGADCNMFIEGRQVAISRHLKRRTTVSTLPLFVNPGRKSLDIVFVRREVSWPSPSIVLWWKTPWNGKWEVVPSFALSRNPGAYPPVIHSVSPTRAPVGSVITLTGSSFVEVDKVMIGGNLCIGVEVKSEHKLSCVLPGGSGTTFVKVLTSTGKESNFRLFTFSAAFAIRVKNKHFLTVNKGDKPKISKRGTGNFLQVGLGYYSPIKFKRSKLKWSNGKVFQGKTLTTIAIGPDNKYYVGSLNGFVHVLKVSSNMRVTDYCRSANIGYTRSILGLAFNPRDFPHIKLYASSSVLYWGVKKLMFPFSGWRNGEVVMFTPSKNKDKCLTMTKKVITGLPVSNHDHGVNSLAFTTYGSLLISVGGSTNAGISTPGDFLGGVPDSQLSGAMLIAEISKKGFNGKITYDKPASPGAAKKISGDVFLFASGLRNCMGHFQHSNGNIYATDNGANEKYGRQSTNCRGGSVPSVNEKDSFKIIARHSYHGYANLLRGKRSAWNQCTHHTPKSGGKGWTRPLETFDASTNGLAEYTANTFGGQMRGDVLATKFASQSNGITYRLQIGGNGLVKSKSVLADHSGLTPALTPRGGLLMPRVYQGTIAVLEPIESNPKVTVVTSVFPTRGPKWGGIRVLITGWNLYPPLTAYFGGKVCKNSMNFAKDGRSFSCVIPAGTGKVPVIVKRKNGQQSGTHKWEFWYMA